MSVIILTSSRVPAAVDRRRHQTPRVVAYVVQAAQSETGTLSDCTTLALFLTPQSTRLLNTTISINVNRSRTAPVFHRLRGALSVYKLGNTVHVRATKSHITKSSIKCDR